MRTVEDMKKLIWNVGYKIEEDKAHGINEAYVIIASFANYQNAEDFIIKCMPEETKERFFVECDKGRMYPANHIFKEY